MSTASALFDYLVIGLIVCTVIAAVGIVVAAYWDDLRAFWKDTRED
jgi:hypothetical protein